MINQQAALKLISQIACVSTGIVKVDGGDRARLLLISKLIAETSLIKPPVTKDYPMDEFKNDTYKLLVMIQEEIDKIVEHTEHPQDVSKAITRLIREFAKTH